MPGESQSLAPVFSLDDIRASFDQVTFRRGMAYAQTGRVIRIERHDGGDLQAQVRGQAALPYDVTVETAASKRGTRLISYCDCPIEYKCKHGAAAAIAALGNIKGGAAQSKEYDPTDPVVHAWLSELDAYREVAAAPRGEHIRYVLDIPDDSRRITLTARVVALLKSGERSMGRAVELQNLSHTGGSYVTPIDRTIGRLATAAGISGHYAWTTYGASISPRLLAMLLAEIIGTERTHWRSTKAPPLIRRDLADQQLAWHLDGNARQRPIVRGRASARILPASPTWYVDPERSESGSIDCGVSAELAALVAGAPPLTAHQARRAQTVWKRVFANNAVPAPLPDIATEIVERDPVAVLRLHGIETGQPRSPALAAVVPAFAELAFEYGSHRVRLSDAAREFQEIKNGRIVLWPRRAQFEAAARAQLAVHGFEPLGWPEVQYVEHRGSALHFPGTAEQHWARFLGSGVAELEARGWSVQIEPSFPYEIVEAGEWDARVEPAENRWFEFDLGINIGQERVSLLPIVVDALRNLGVRSQADLAQLGKDAVVYGRLAEGKFVALPAERIAPLLATLIELFDEPITEEGRLSLTPAHFASLAQLDAQIPVRWVVGEVLRGLVRTLADENSLPVAALPESFRGELRQYQSRGVSWLQLLARNGFGGVLADDMGLGKTVQLLAHVAIEKSAKRLRKPVLIVSPTSVSPNWRAEAARFVPRLRVLALTAGDRAERFDQIERHDIVLTTYALLQRDIETLSAHEWQMVVLDEAQAIKNPRSKGAQATALLRAGQRLALTGTPMENHLDELWSVFSFAIPGLLGDRKAFGRTFRSPIEKRGDAERRRVLASRLRPFLLRRTKESVALDLPEKSEIVTRIDLEGPQRDLYETIRIAMHERVRSELKRRGLARSQIIVLDALLKLRQVCCDPRLLKLAAARNVRGSAKLEALMEMIPELIEEGRRILLFSQFTSMLDLIKPELRERDIAFVELRGETKDRVTPIRSFQSGEVPLFLISLKAGGTGLNLTAADAVIHYDPWWNPAVERQATDRAHRIGQHRPVFVYKLITAGTVEERILDMQRRKAELAAGLFEESGSLLLDVAEVDRLFAPLQ